MIVDLRRNSFPEDDCANILQYLPEITFEIIEISEVTFVTVHQYVLNKAQWVSESFVHPSTSAVIRVVYLWFNY